MRYWIRVVSRGNLQNPIFIVKESTKVGEERERERDMRRRCWTKQNDCASVLCPVEKRSRRDFFSIVSLALSLLLLGTLPVWLYQGEEKETKARGGGGVCYGRMWILEKAFEVDCAEVAGHLVLYIYIERLHGTKYLSLKGSQAEKTSSPRLKMLPFSTDIDPRRCSSRDYTARSWFPSFSVSSRQRGQGNICRTREIYETNSEGKSPIYRYLTFGKMNEKKKSNSSSKFFIFYL